jgi:hypothetical protein
LIAAGGAAGTSLGYRVLFNSAPAG